MDIDKLKTWQSVEYPRVVRGEDTYAATERYFESELKRLIDMYVTAEDPQSKRLVRDSVDFCLRRYHQYSVRGRMGAHYREAACTGPFIFEHLIPAAEVRDMLLGSALSIRAALNSPTVLLSQENDARLRTAGLVSSTADVFYPFRRYRKAGIDCAFQDWMGNAIDVDTWSIEDHYRLVQL